MDTVTIPYPKAILCDLDGVVWRGKEVLSENVQQLLRWAFKVPLLFLTNNSTQHRDVVAKRLSDLGFPRPQVVTSGWVAAQVLHQEGIRRVLVVGEEGLRREVREVGVRIVWKDAELVLVGMDRRATYEKLNRAFVELQRGARFWATNLDVAYPVEGMLHLGAGSLVGALEKAWGPPERSFGKPAKEIFLYALACVGISPGPEVWMIGDRLDTDMVGASRLGLTPIWVSTGVSKRPPDGFKGWVGIPDPATVEK